MTATLHHTTALVDQTFPLAPKQKMSEMSQLTVVTDNSNLHVYQLTVHYIPITKCTHENSLGNIKQEEQAKMVPYTVTLDYQMCYCCI